MHCIKIMKALAVLVSRLSVLHLLAFAGVESCQEYGKVMLSEKLYKFYFFVT